MRLGISLAFFVVESAVFAIITISPYASIGTLLRIHTTLAAVLFALALFLRKVEWVKPYWPVCTALFVDGAAVLVSTLYPVVQRTQFGVRGR